MLLLFRLETELVSLDLDENGLPVVLGGVSVHSCHIDFSHVGELDLVGYMILDSFEGSVVFCPP